MAIQEKERKGENRQPEGFIGVYKDDMVQAYWDVEELGRFPGITVTTLARPGDEYLITDNPFGWGSKVTPAKVKVPNGMERIAVTDKRNSGQLGDFQREAGIVANRRAASTRG